MNLDPYTIGSAFLSITSLLTAYLLVLRIREYSVEKPDPKLTYATLTQLEKQHQLLIHYENQYKKDIETLRLEIKSDYAHYDNRQHQNTQLLHKMARESAQQISSLVAQVRLISQRMSELTLKTDKLLRYVK